MVGNDVVNFVLEFHATSKLPKAITASFIAPIPKKDNPQTLGEYRRLISLIGCIYKIFAKIVSNRLKRVLGKVISHTQNAFLPRRQIIDGISPRGEKVIVFLLKVDFEKTYDSVS